MDFKRRSSIILLTILFFTAGGVKAQEYVHRNFDWEGDDINEDDPPDEFESCYACHDGGMFPLPDSKRKQCEDCHVIKGVSSNPEGPYVFYDLGYANQNYSLRPDYEGIAPVVYSHMRFPNETTNYISCLTYDPKTGEGVCHGVSIDQSLNSGGFFTFNSTSSFPLDAPYSRALPVDYYPDSKDCLFCHTQDQNSILLTWGNPLQIRVSGLIFKHFNASNSHDCLGCHYKGNITNFHSKGLYVERLPPFKKLFLPVLSVLLLILFILLGYLIIRRKKLDARK